MAFHTLYVFHDIYLRQIEYVESDADVRCGGDLLLLNEMDDSVEQL